MAFFDERYREPLFEECINGLEFEIYTHKEEWVKGFYPSILDKNKELDRFGDDYEQKLAHAIIRVKAFKPINSSNTDIGPHKIFLESQRTSYTGPCLVRESRPCGQCKNFSKGFCTKKNITVSIDEYSPIWAYQTCFE